VEGVEMKGVGSGWSRQTCQLHTCFQTSVKAFAGTVVCLALRVKK